MTKSKILDFKKNLDRREEYDVQLRLEYEIRLEINKLYALKHTHESELVGLEKRLSEIEFFNTNTELLQTQLDQHIVSYFETCESKMLGVSRLAVSTRLSDLLAVDQTVFKVTEPQDAEEPTKINLLYSCSITRPVSLEQFKQFLSGCLLEGRQL